MNTKATTVQGLVGLSIRILCIWIIVFTLNSALTLRVAYPSAPAWIVPASIIFTAILAATIWKLAFFIAALCIPEPIKNSTASLSPVGLLQVATCFLGLMLLTESFPEVVKALAWIYFNGDIASDTAITNTRLTLISDLLSAIIGLYLIFRSGPLIRLIIQAQSKQSEG